jgi:hypothetical protein
MERLVFSAIKHLGRRALATTNTNRKMENEMVKFLTAIAVALMALPVAAVAEVPAKVTQPSATTAPLEGANSFTEAQARKRIEDAGFTGIGALSKDDQGIWRTAATKNGATMTVSVDFKGNVTTDKVNQ